jgi:hypothetical protein
VLLAVYFFAIGCRDRSGGLEYPGTGGTRWSQAWQDYRADGVEEGAVRLILYPIGG